MALIVAPEPPLGNWLAALDEQLRRSAGFFADRPVVANLAAAFAAGEALEAALDALGARGLRIIGIEGVDPDVLADTSWARLPRLVQGRDISRDAREGRPIAVPDDRPPAPEPPAAPAPLLIDRPVRSGQSIVFEQGDVTVVGPVSSGAEIIAGGSIHIYGPLRGRAIAGLRAGAAARIFCRKLAAELVAIDGVYCTADEWAPDLRNRAVQIRLAGDELRLSAFE
jgi:septum site-determining protein MinC